MSHDHGHGGCGDHAHEHELPGNVLGYQDNLYNQIDRPHVVALNANGQGQTVIKPWSERNDEVSVGSSLVTLTLAHLIENKSTSNRMLMISCMFRIILSCMVAANDGWRILRVPFTASVKLRALLIKAGPGDNTPDKVSLVGMTIGCGREESNRRI